MVAPGMRAVGLIKKPGPPRFMRRADGRPVGGVEAFGRRGGITLRRSEIDIGGESGQHRRKVGAVSL